jgi:hypothetical protein
MTGVYLSRAFDISTVWLVLLFCAIVAAQTHTPNVELQLRASKVVDGLPVLAQPEMENGRSPIV